MPGMTKISKSNSLFGFGGGGGGGGGDTGTIEAIPKDKTEKMFEVIRAKINEAKERKSQPSTVVQQQQQQRQRQRQSPTDLLKTKFVNGEIASEEYEAKKKSLRDKYAIATKICVTDRFYKAQVRIATLQIRLFCNPGIRENVEGSSGNNTGATTVKYLIDMEFIPVQSRITYGKKQI